MIVRQHPLTGGPGSEERPSEVGVDDAPPLVEARLRRRLGERQVVRVHEHLDAPEL